MKLINYELGNVIDLFKTIYDIDDMYAKNGKSDQSSKSYQDRVQFGANANSILSMVSANFLFADMTVFDLETMKGIATSVQTIGDAIISHNPTDVDITILKTKLPDIYNYTNESKSVLETIEEDKDNEEGSYHLYSIGSIKFRAIVTFRGKDILTLFDGFLENYIYSTFRSRESLDTDDAENIVKRDTLTSLMQIFMRTSYQASQKPTLVEDYLIDKKYYSYIKYVPEPYTFSLAEVNFSLNKLRFFGDEATSLYQNLSILKKDLKDKIIGTSSPSNIMFTIVISSNLWIYMLMKLYGRGFNIVANQKYDILYSNANFENELEIDPDIKMKYMVRINNMLKHNKECRNIIINDKNTETDLSHPSRRYGMIIMDQHIKYIIQIPLSEIYDFGIAFDDVSFKTELKTDVHNMIISMKNFLISFKEKYIDC